MHKINTTLTLAACVAALFLGSNSAWSEEDDEIVTPVGPWNLSPTATPFRTPESAISIGFGYLDGERQQFGIFDDQRDNSWRILLDGTISMRDEATGTWRTLRARNLGLNDNRDVTLGLEKQGTWGVRVGYNEIPRIAPYSVNSNTEGLATTNQVIPQTDIAGEGETYQIRSDVDRLTLDTFYFLNKKIKFKMSFKNETKEGSKQWGRRQNGAPEFLLEPVDWNTRQLDTTLGYVNNDLQLLAGYTGSWFGNENNLVDTTRQGDDLDDLSNHTYLSLPLDNEAHKAFLSGGYNFSPLTRAAFKLSYTHATQNEHLPTTDIIGLSNDVTTPPSSLEGEVNTTLASLELTTRPIPKLSILTKLSYYEQKDKTPTWLVVETNRGNIHSTPISNKTITGKVEGTYRLPYQTTLTGGVEQKNQDRDIPFGTDADEDGLDEERFVPWRTELDETIYRMQIRRNLSETINGALGFEHGVRTGDAYSDSVKIMGNDQGKIAPFFIADRDRDKLRFSTDWRPIDRLGFQFVVENALDRYQGQEPYGRKKGHAQLYSIDTDFAPTDKWLFTAWYSYDINKTWQEAGHWTFGGVLEGDNSSALEDIGSSLGLGIRNQWNYKLKLGADFQQSRSKSSYKDTVLVYSEEDEVNHSGMTPLPEIISTTTNLSAFVEYQGLGPGTLRCDFIHERWRTDDWTWQYSDGSSYIYGTETDSTMITTDDNQSSNFIGIRYTTRF